ncbi:MAG: hypothetical protein ACKOPN_04815 [Prochlorococcaceae cyanobacterium]
MSASASGQPGPPAAADRSFNNADSFAQAFDAAWDHHSQRHPAHGLSVADKLELILTGLQEHPFCLESPALARQVGLFRIRLLGLDNRP